MDVSEIIKAGRQAMNQLESQLGAMDKTFENTIAGLNGGDKEKIQRLQVGVNRIVRKAKEGKPIEEDIERIKQSFKAETDGSNSNR